VNKDYENLLSIIGQSKRVISI